MAPARGVNRLAPSLAMFLSFFFLGVFMSALGPAVPALSRDVDAQEASFGMAFSLRGLGHLLGSWSAPLKLPPMGLKPQLRQALNNRMNRLGVATTGIGLFSIALAAAGSFWLGCACGFLQGFCGGAIDAIGNAGISDVHGTEAAPWMQVWRYGAPQMRSSGNNVVRLYRGMERPQARDVNFGVALLLQHRRARVIAIVGQLGYQKVFVAFGLLAMPSSVACCLADDGGGNRDNSSDWAVAVGNGQGMLPQEEADERAYSTNSTASSKSDTEITTIAEVARRPSYGSLDYGTGQHFQLQEDPTVISPAPTGITTPTKNTTFHGVEAQGSKPPGAAARVSILGDKLQAKHLGESMEAAHMLPYASPPCRNKVVGGDVLVPQLFKLSETALIPREGGEGKPPPVSLIALLAFFCFLYIGAEVGFGGWVAVVVLRDALSGEAGAVRMASLFWIGITVGRLLAMPLAVRFSNGFLISANLLGGLLSSLLLLSAGRVSYSWAALGVGLFGLSMASTFPLAMSLLPSAGYILSGKNSSRMVVAGALGEMLIPALIAALLGPDDGGWPAVLYVVCVVISVLLLLVYGTCCVLLKGAGRRFGQGEGEL